MATSSFKSTSRRSTTSSSSTSTGNKQPRNHLNSTQKVPPRRSRSVSALSRSHFDITTEFHNKRDNPLFWVDGSSNFEEDLVDLNNLKGSCNGNSNSNCCEERRGRSVSRNSGGEKKLSAADDGKKDFGRSLSRVSIGRRSRSPSRGHYENYESGSRIHRWDDEISSLSEAEEKTIEPVSVEKITPLEDINGTPGVFLETVHSEVRQAMSDMQYDLKNEMLRSSSDVAPELEIPNTVALVRDIREEFSRELEECEERKRKLRAELAVEEHREIELNTILSDYVPEPKTPLMQKPGAVRKASFERKKISKRLEEEALAFFDECVSISTFEDSEFSSLEDLPSNIVSFDGPDSERVGLPGVPSCTSVASSFKFQDDIRRTAVVQRHEGSDVPVNCCSGRKQSEYTLTSNASDTTSLVEDIRKYIKIFSMDDGRERSDPHIVRSSRDYSCEVPKETLLLDRLTFRSRIESGSMLLCDGGVGLSVAPFSSVLW